MPEPNKKPDGEHIEELLSQLKGIFGHLSESEQEEAKQKITPPTPPPATSPPDAPPLDDPKPSSPVVPPDASSVETVPFAPAPEINEPQAPSPSTSAYTPNEVTVPEGAKLLPAAIFYPVGRDVEARTLTGKIEHITPKFTKVAVVLNIQTIAPYEPKTDLKLLMPQIGPSIKAVFVLVDKALDDARRKTLLNELEPRGIYFQDIPILQIEKKAVYTDMLLGLVFFFDSQKGPSSGEANT